MENKKTLINVVKSEIVKGKAVFECEEVETGQTVLLKKNPKLDTKLSYGKKYWMRINENWINYVEPFEETEPLEPKTNNSEEKYSELVKNKAQRPNTAHNPENKTLGLMQEEKQNIILAQSCMKNAVDLYGLLHKKDEPIDYDKLFEIHRGVFTYMKEEGYR